MKRDSQSIRQQSLRATRRMVVKVGSAVLTADGRLKPRAVGRLVADIMAVRGDGIEVVLVSSGAVASGLDRLGLSTPPRSIDHKQAAAAIGQPRLMRSYARAFDRCGVQVGQVLLTDGDLADRSRFLNIRRTLAVLLTHKILPIVNENDSVSFDEIKIGDNDRLSGLVAHLVSADLLVLLTNVDGILEGGPTGRRIPLVPPDHCLMKHVDPKGSPTGTGGIATKIEAATLAGKWGIPTVVADGNRRDTLQQIIAGSDVGTFFVPTERKTSSRKGWIALAARVRGTLVVDHGASVAITRKHKSLLPSGIVAVRGEFPRGCPVEIEDSHGAVLARGLTCYSSNEIERIMGHRTSQIPSILGYAYAPEVVHCDDLVLSD